MHQMNKDKELKKTCKQNLSEYDKKWKRNLTKNVKG